ncbi:hypothetical protein [Paenibacillus dendritiformis]|uniref:hypothetical protein n=1 Tax=Paenibacillus dendritiformis TaxID=130049 RepID=UPI00387E135D
MIEWQQYDPANPPKEYESFLIIQEYEPEGMVCTAFYTSGFWIDCREHYVLEKVTHYATINLPDEEEEETES